MTAFTKNIPVDILDANLISQHDVHISVARLDKLHPIVSGNKLFKLSHFIAAAASTQHRTLITFGGAYSNHLVATAFACREAGIKSIGMVRGEIAEELSHTLRACTAYGMELHFLSRSDYKNTQLPAAVEVLQQRLGSCTIVPEGGYHPHGAHGAAHIMDHLALPPDAIICLAVGTATTLAGIVRSAQPGQHIIAVPVLKGLTDIPHRLDHLLGEGTYIMPEVVPDGHFGGYAKKTNALIGFMNALYAQHHIPTDFVYTGKLLFTIFEKIRNGHFAPGSNIVCLHTGGLQGNASLPAGTLNF